MTSLARTGRAAWLITSLLPVLVPAVIFLHHAREFGRWIVDDAGITFAYARNLAQGHGLVSQPGVPPVEGYSNFLWVLTYAACFAVKLFDPVRTPKLLSIALVLACFLVARRLFRRGGDEDGAATLVALCLLGMNTSFVAWCVSGLENPLYSLLLCLLAWQTLEAALGGRSGLARAMGAGALAAAIAMTRPEGVVYFPAYPLAVAIARRADRPRSRHLWGPLAGYLAALVLLFGGFLLFRRHYFGDWLPNTYYAKMASGSPADPAWSAHGPLWLRLLDLVGSVVGPRIWAQNGALPAITPPNLLDSPAERRSLLLLVAVLLATAWLARIRRLSALHGTLGLFALIAAAGYLALPPDWMEEYRYATPFFLFFYLYGTAVGEGLIQSLKLSEPARLAVGAAAAAAALLITSSVFAPRTAAFAARPTVPLQDVKQWLADRFDWYASALGLRRASLLVPDAGATLFYSRLRIYDLGMLCDRTIARTMGKDQQAFYDYIFDIARPTFIHTHGSWSYRARLDADPRFRRDYLPITEYREPWRPSGLGTPVYSGDYVRKDAVAGREQALASLARWGQPAVRPRMGRRGGWRRAGMGRMRGRGARRAGRSAPASMEE